MRKREVIDFICDWEDKGLDYIIEHYVPRFFDDDDLSDKINKYKKNGQFQDINKRISELIFREITNDEDLNIVKMLIEFNYPNSSKFEPLLVLINKYNDIISSDDVLKKFRECKNDIIQLRFIDYSADKLHQKYIDNAMESVQNTVFKEHIARYELSHISQNKFLNRGETRFPNHCFVENKELVKRAIELEINDVLTLREFLSTEEIIKRISARIFRKLPADLSEELFNLDIYLNLIGDERIAIKNLKFNDGSYSLTNTELFKLMVAGKIEQRETDSPIHLELNMLTLYIDDIVRIIKNGYRVECGLTIQSCKDLPIELIETLKENRINIISVKFDREELQEIQKQSYTITEYIKGKQIIDKIIKKARDLSHTYENDPDKEKKLYGQIAKILSNLVVYNYNYYRRLKRHKTSKEEDIENASFIYLLLYGQGVCAAIADAIYNLALCAGLEAKYIGAKNINPKKFGHAWNQLQLDGEWHNSDITWAMDELSDDMDSWYFLANDRDFGHNEYIPRCETAECTSIINNTNRLLMKNNQIKENVHSIKMLRIALIRELIDEDEVKRFEEKRKVAELGTNCDKTVR